MSKPGVGKLLVLTATMIRGVGTQFKKELMPGDTIHF